LDKKVKKELKQTLKHTKDLLSVDSSTVTGMQKDDVDSINESGADSLISSSMQSSQKPKGSKMAGSQEKSNTNKDKATSPNSSFAQASKNSETQMSKATYEPVVNNQKVRQAFNEELPKTIVYPLKYVERLLSQNQFHFRQIAYKDYPISKEEFEVKTKKNVTDFASMGLGGENVKEDDQATKKYAERNSINYR